MSRTCRCVMPAEIGTTVAPSVTAPWWTPSPPVNRPYPYALWIVDAFVAPAPTRQRAIIRPHRSRSPFVYPTRVGRPPVPDDPCRHTTWSSGTASMPYGYDSHRSVLVVVGSRGRSSRVSPVPASTPAARRRCACGPSRASRRLTRARSRSVCRAVRSSTDMLSAGSNTMGAPYGRAPAAISPPLRRVAVRRRPPARRQPPRTRPAPR